jgi:hypothetical protein
MCTSPSFRYADRTIFVFGLPRSGTTWLGKILDSHPKTIYRHEPALSLPNTALKTDCEWTEHADENKELASVWLNQLAMLRNVRTVSTIPVFRKAYHTPIQRALRSTYIYGLKILGTAPVLSNAFKALRVPDFVDFGKADGLKLVIKSINPKRNLPLFLAAAPNSRFIFILRDPRSQIASVVRGVRMRRLRWDGIENTRSEQDRLELIRTLANEWIEANTRAIEHIGSRRNCYVLRHEDLVSRPMATAKDVLSFCGLDWRYETAAFLEQSMRRPLVKSYFGLRRHPDDAIHGWQSELSSSEVGEIRSLVKDSVPGKLYLPSFKHRPDRELAIRTRSAANVP